MAFEKVNMYHPDKVMDRIAGAVVDLCVSKDENARVAVEGVLGHGICTLIAETSADIKDTEVIDIIHRISGPDIFCQVIIVPQDIHLADNQKGKIRCGDNGVFRSEPMNEEMKELTRIAMKLTEQYPYDGKYVLHNNDLIICQSNAKTEDLIHLYPQATINPLGDWTGGTNVDTGAVNRKLGSDMPSPSGGGLVGKDCSKADVSVNIYAFLKAQETGKPVELYCAIGEEWIDGKPYEEIVAIAKKYIKELGGYEKFAEWGLIR